MIHLTPLWHSLRIAVVVALFDHCPCPVGDMVLESAIVMFVAMCIDADFCGRFSEYTEYLP